MSGPSSAIEMVLRWQRCATDRDLDGLLALSDPDIEVGGPRGSARGHEVVRGWIARTGIALKPLRVFARRDLVVVEQEATWNTGGEPSSRIIGTAFRVAAGAVKRVVRYDSLDEALAAAGLRVDDEAGGTLVDKVTTPPSVSFQGIDHVQLAAPPGCEAEGRRFFGELLGLDELPKPAALAGRGGLWFRCGAHQLHIGVEKDFRAAKKAHPALRLADERSIEQLKSRLVSAGVAVIVDDDVRELARFFAEDPWGNRLEFVAPRGPR